MKTLKNTIAILGLIIMASCSKEDEPVTPTPNLEPTTTDLNYSNGNLSTGETSNNGTAAPTGCTWSEVQFENGTYGYSAYGDNLVADDFIVPTGEKWTINKFIFYAYQTNFAGTNCPINDVKYTIYSNNPSAAGASSVFGNFVTNKYATAEDSKIYRIYKDAPDSKRKIYKITASATDLVLQPGTYWIKWQSKNIDNSAHFFPPNTTLNSTGLENYNAIGQNLGVWNVLADGVNKVDFPFGIVGTKTKI